MTGMKKALNILITTSWYPTDKSTHGVFVKEQAEALSKAGHNVSVLLVNYNTPVGWLKTGWPHYDESNLVSQIHLKVVFPLPGRFFSDPSAWYKAAIIKRALLRMKKHFGKNGKPDIIHHHTLSDNAYIAEAISKEFKIPYVFTEHSNYFSYEELNKFNTFESFADHKRFVQNAAARIAVSRIRAEGYAKIFDAAFEVVPNMVQEIFADEIQPRGAVSVFTFACVAILDKRKRQDLLIRCFTKAFRGQPVRLVLAGSGQNESEYRKLVEETGMTDQVTFFGKASRAQVKRLFDESQAAVLSSDQETFGVVLAEAMFRGIPVISTISGGPEEIITPETGLLCPKGDADALTGALISMRADYFRYKPAEIRKYAMDNFSEQKIVQQLKVIYLKAISNVQQQ